MWKSSQSENTLKTCPMAVKRMAAKQSKENYAYLQKATAAPDDVPMAMWQYM
jgi:hypothetical protein